MDDPATVDPAQSTAAPEPVGPTAAAPVDCCEVCIVAPRDCISSMWIRSFFCEIFAKQVAELPTGCPVDFLYDYVCMPFDTIDRQ